jgi:hypothetical protein
MTFTQGFIAARAHIAALLGLLIALGLAYATESSAKELETRRCTEPGKTSLSGPGPRALR